MLSQVWEYGTDVIHPALLSCSILLSVYSIAAYALLVSKYARVHTNGSVYLYVLAMKDLGSSLAPTSLILDILKKKQVVCTFDYLSDRAFAEAHPA